MNSSLRILFSVVLLFTFLSSHALPQGNADKKNPLRKTAVANSWQAFTVNRFTNLYYNDGRGSVTPDEGMWASIYPKGGGIGLVYEDGLLVGGKRLGRLFMDGSTYGSGMQPGRILTPGTGADKADAIADDPNLPVYRVFRVRPDINPNTVSRSVAIEKLLNDDLPYTSGYRQQTAEEVYDQYVKDWNEWPAGQGAPFDDIDIDGIYEPKIDIPGVPGGNQTLWHVFNDMDSTKCFNFYAALPVGLEVQRTIWGYNRMGALGNIIFIRYRLINKSGAQLDSCYISMFSDTDLGDAWDDLGGCDTSTNMGYSYNGFPVDQLYGNAPPAVGYVILSGPVVNGAPEDSAIVDFTRLYGKKNLGMTAFEEFISGGPPDFQDPSLGSRNILTGAVRWYNAMRGLKPRTGLPYVDPNGDTTAFVCAGDPLEKTGWVDGVYPYTPASRNINTSSGPFSIANGQTQECVIGLVAAQGSDRLSSVSLLRRYARDAQAQYNRFFQPYQPPPAPVVTKSEVDGAIVLAWGDPDKARGVETFSDEGYTFEGYRVTQMKSSTPGPNDVVIAECNAAVGLRRSILVTRDTLLARSLVNGRTYYFGVSAWSRNLYPKEGDPSELWSASTVVSAIPQSSAFGVQYNTSYGDVLSLIRTGKGDGTIVAKIALPTAVQSGTYTVDFDSTDRYAIRLGSGTLRTFGTKAAISDMILGGISWSLADYSYDPPSDILNRNVSVHRAAGSNLAWLGTATYFGNSSGFYKSMTTVDAVTIPASKTQWDLQLRFTGVPTPGATTTDTVITGGGQMTTLWPKDARATMDVSAFTPKIVRGPFELWDTENNIQINYSVIDRNFDYASPWGSTNASFTAYTNPAWVRWKGRAFIVVDYAPYDSTKSITPVDNNATFLLMFNETGLWKTGDTATIHIINPVIAGTDKYTFALNADTSSPEIEKAQVMQISVYPNPYFAFNRVNPLPGFPYVTLNHLPQRANLRIFNILGHLVRTIVKDTPSQFAYWDLTNDSGIYVGSGIYVIHIDMPTLGTSKVLKLAVIPPRF